MVDAHDPAAVGQPFTLNLSITPPANAETPIDAPVPAFPAKGANSTVETLILVNQTRLNGRFGGAAAGIPGTLNTLKNSPLVNGEIVNLDAYPALQNAYAVWDADSTNVSAANYVARSIKALLYSYIPAYSNLKYIVIVGDDRIVPARRIVDEALRQNERLYTDAQNPAAPNAIGSASAKRYYLSDDYYAGLIPLPWKARELYLPQLGIGRLVETPADITLLIQTFLAQPTITPASALVTGYTFLNDQANAVNETLQDYGVANRSTLINDTWTANDFRASFFAPTARDLNSLNAHFAHNRLIANDGSIVTASEITNSTAYAGSLIFSVGCHSGLNVPDVYFPNDPSRATDWPQAFARQGASLIGNTAYAYGDDTLIAYSERLIVNFVEQLGDESAGSATTGRALMQAKQRYFNTLGAGTLSNYDEKVLAQMTLFGLPMLKVSLPQPQTSSANRNAPTADQTLALAPEATINTNLSFSYDQNPTNRGTYYTIAGSSDVSVAGGRPAQPRSTSVLNLDGQIAHGVLMLGGSWQDTPNFDPVISRIVTDDVYLAVEPAFPFTQLYPAQVASINRFLKVDGTLDQRLVVIPGQYKANSSSRGTQRLYSNLELQILTAPNAQVDFVAPVVREVTATTDATGLRFRVRVGDDSGAVQRVVVLYAAAGSTSWTRVELPYNPATGYAEAGVAPVNGLINFIVQAADAAGNVRLALDHSNPYRVVPAGFVFAPDAATEPATSISPSGATLNGVVNANNAPTTITFEWGTSSGSYNQTVAATPNTLHSGDSTAVSAVLDGLQANTTYYYRVLASSSGGTTDGGERSFRTTGGVITITSTPELGARQGQSYSYAAQATGIPAPTWSFDTAPDRMTINATTGLVEWTPAVAPGSYAVTIRASNGVAAPATQSFTIVVASAATVSISPVLECVRDNGSSANPRYTARFGYNNRQNYTSEIPVGSNNRFTPDPQNRGQPSVFEPGRQRFVFDVPFHSGNLVWSLNGRTSTASASSSRCQ